MTPYVLAFLQPLVDLMGGSVFATAAVLGFAFIGIVALSVGGTVRHKYKKGRSKKPVCFDDEMEVEHAVTDDLDKEADSTKKKEADASHIDEEKAKKEEEELEEKSATERLMEEEAAKKRAAEEAAKKEAEEARKAEAKKKEKQAEDEKKKTVVRKKQINGKEEQANLEDFVGRLF